MIRPSRLALACTALLALAAAARAQDPPPVPPPEPTPAPEPSPESKPLPAPKPIDDAKPGTPDRPVVLPEVSVIGTRTRRPLLRTPRAVTILDLGAIHERGGGILVDALHERMGLWVEHRTATTGDPVMRGLAGGNILTLVDGNSLSTFWGEGGFGSDDMYGKIDPESIGRIEVVRGPSSVLYGSQALGGVINLHSREVPVEFGPGVRGGAASRVRVSSADHGARWRGEVFGAAGPFRALLGTTVADVNDLDGGRGVGVQANTGGREWNGDARLEWQPAAEHLFTVTLRDVNRRDVHRYYRPTQTNDNDLSSAMLRWQLREPDAEAVRAEVRAFYQRKVDTRYWIDAASLANGRSGRARTETYSADGQLTVPVGPEGNALTFGAGTHLDVGESADDEEFTERRNAWALGPPGERTAGPDTWWWNTGGFVQDVWDVGPLTFTASGRLDYFEFATDPFSSQYYPATYKGTGLLADFQAPDDIRDGSWAVTGGLGASWEPVDGFALFVDGSRGFRQWAPRFGFAQVGIGVLAPSTEMPDPVVSWTGEGGCKLDTRKLRGEAVGYYTRFEGFLQDVPGTWQGLTWYDFDNDGIQDPNENIAVRKASSDAWVGGVELEATYRLDGDVTALGLGPAGWWDGLALRGGFMWNYGRDQEAHGPFRHTHPARGVIALRWEEPTARRFFAEVSLDMVRKFHRVPADRIATDTAYLHDPADPASGRGRYREGLPGYAVVNVRGGVRLAERLDLTLGVDNVADRRYRRAHSRIRSDGGLNAFASLRVQVG